MSHERPVLSSCNETMPGRGTLYHTLHFPFTTLIVWSNKRAFFFLCLVFFVHDAAPSRLYFVKVSLSLIPRTGEQGQIYRKRGLPQGVTMANNVARFLSRFKSSSLVKKLLNYSIITLNISLQKLQFF